MLTKNELKYYASLLKKKFRHSENKFVVEGNKIIEEALSNGYKCELVCATSEYINLNTSFIKNVSRQNIRLEVIKQHELEKLSDTKSPQGVCAVFSIREALHIVSYNNSIVVMLDNISDPGNLGTIIRTCDWFGINEIILSETSADLFNSKVIRSTMGSLFHVPIIRYGELTVEINEFKKNGYTILTADLEGDNIYNYKPVDRSVIIFSSESHGPSDELVTLADKIITIPRIGKAESLNVASAAAIIISHLTK